MEFDNTSRDVWEEMRAGTPFSPPPRDTGPYTEDFYGKHDEYVDFSKLKDYIVRSESDGTTLFNYKSYVSKLEYYLMVAMNPPEKLILSGNTAFSFLHDNKVRVVQFYTSLNKRVDYVSPSIGYSIFIDEKSGKAVGTYNVYYANTNDKRISYDATENPNDFTISDKYKAIILRTNNLEDFYQLYIHLNGTLQAEHIRQEIVDELLKALNKTKSASTLAFLYSIIPDCALLDLSSLLDKTVLLEHLYILKSSDENSWFSDTSGTLIRLLQLMCYSNTDFLVTICIKHPRLIKDLYFNMDAKSTINGVTQTNKSLFANLLYALTIMHGSKEFNKIHHVYKIGKHYFQDSNVKASNDFFPNKIFLKQYRSWERPTTWFEDAVNRYPLRHTTDEAPLNNRHYYYPMDLVMLIDMDSEDKTPVWVPAIFLKYLADEKEWKDIMFYIRIGADVLAIILGVFTLGTSLYFLAALEIGVAAADILITIASDALMQTDWGRTFLETWNIIMITGGVALAPLLLINTAFRTGAALLRLAKNVATINFIRASLMKIILEVNIVNFTRGTMSILVTTEEVVKGSRFLFKSSHITELQKAGVLFLKVEEKVSETVTRQGMAVFYEGQMIAIGDIRRVKELLKDVWGLKGQQLLSALDKIWKEIPKLDHTKRFWIANNKAGKSLRWINQKGGIKSAIDSAVENTKNSSKQWEGLVAQEVSQFEEITNFGNEVSVMENGKVIKSAGEFDASTPKYIFECKESLSKGVLNSGDFEKQMIKFIDESSINYINLSNKKVVVVIKNFGEGINLSHPTLKRLAKKVIFITDLNQLKTLY